MIDLKVVGSVLTQLEEERGIPREKIIEAIELALATAYKKEYGKKGQIIRAKFDINSGKTEMFQVKKVVDETTVVMDEDDLPEYDPTADPATVIDLYNPEQHIMVDDARRIKKNVTVGEEMIFPLEAQDDYSRIAAQTAKQVIMQKIREAEKVSVMSEYGKREGEIVSGTVQRIERGNIFIDFGASKKEDILALKNIKDQAAKVATELLGDYANITAFGKDMRQTLAPFWSWYEVNLKRYARLTANSFDKGWEEGIKTSATLASLKGTAFLAKWLIRAMLLTGGVTLYNHLVHPEIEDNLSQYDRSRLHINIGKTKDGRIVILRTQSSFGDILEWLGLDGAPTLTKQYFDGKASLGDIFGTIPFTNIPAFGLNPADGEIGLHPAVLKILRAIGPLYKVPTETLTGYSWGGFDDKEYKIEDRKRNIAKLVSLENEYDAIAGNPSRGYFNSLAEAFVSTSDPEENAYRYIQSLKYQYKETVLGQGGSGDYYSPNSILYRKYKKAIRFGDKDVADKIMSKMKEKGIDKEGLKKSLEASDPLFGLSKKDKVVFEKTYLSDSDREKLKRARTYYKKVFLGQ
jgi:hypothetical protein